MVKLRDKLFASLRMSICVILVMAISLPLAGAAVSAYEPDLSEYSYQFAMRYNSWPGHEDEAYILESLGLFRGTENGFELGRRPNRIEALVTVIRLIGKEAEALELNLTSTFSDVPEWATAYAGYGEAQGLVQGMGGGLLGSYENVTAVQYATMMLRVLGYSDSKGDFTYDGALEFSHETELITDKAFERYTDAETTMLRDDMVYFMHSALTSREAGDGQLLILKLCAAGSLDSAGVYGTMTKKGETGAEIERALKNGYSEYWYKRLCAAIDSNSGILHEFTSTFKDYVYTFLKETFFSGAASNMEYSLSQLKTSIVSAYEDSIFVEYPSTLAYYSYPNRIVVRHDLDPALYASTLTHELRHATTGNFENTTIEEGMTDLWNHEVNNGLPAYRYYCINTVKLLAFLAGADKFNEADILGGLEDIIYAIELSAGTRIDKNTFPYNIYRLSDEEDVSSALRDVNTELMRLIGSYYDNNYQDMIASAASEEEFIDTLIALAQLLYYPSAMVQNAESDRVSGSPSSYYTSECVGFIEENLARYSDETGASLSDLRSYYSQNRDVRYCMKFYGSDAGRIMVRSETAYSVIYSYGGSYYAVTFGSSEAADSFKKQANVVSVSELQGEAFVAKEYN